MKAPPLKIGSVILPNNLILAPLAGYGDLPFRLLCRDFGAGMCVSEMISCHGLFHRQQKTLTMLRTVDKERPVSFQLFGSDADIMGEAAVILDSFKPDIIDINMGCPVRKVTKRGAGAALMTDMDKAREIIRAVVSGCSCPVTVKIRSGPDSRTINAPLFAKMAEDNGISAVAVHGRTWTQAFSGTSDWKVVAALKETVSIPVIGNGDITSAEEAYKKIAETGCDGVMIGRAALGNPWVFDPKGRPERPEIIASAALQHMEYIEEFCEESVSKLGAIKNHLGKYFKGFRGSSTLRREIYAAGEWLMLKTLVEKIAGKDN